MTSPNINPIGMVVNLVIGWFVLSFLQAALRAIVSAGGPGLWAGFLDIALFRNGSAVLINLIAIIVLGGIGTVLWFLAKK
jgi:hypothetical protein